MSKNPKVVNVGANPRQPTVQDLYNDYHSAKNRQDTIVEMFFKNLNNLFQDNQQKDLIIANLQKQIQEIQPNAVKPKMQELPKSEESKKK